MASIAPIRTQAAHSENLRSVNRDLILNLIRTRQPLSRADLARLAGITRGTVSLVIQDLLDARWVTEGPVGRLPIGRHPTLIRLTDNRLLAAVALSSLDATVALADFTGNIQMQHAVSLPADRDEAMQELIAAIRRLTATVGDRTIEGIGVSLPSHRNGPSRWIAREIEASLAAAIGVPVEADSAGNACVLAARWFDAIPDTRDRVAVVVSDQLHAGLFLNGNLVQGLDRQAGNFGHIQLDPMGPVCECGSRGCWEVLASNRAALRYYAGPGTEAQGLRFADLLQLAQRGDASAAKALETMAYWLGLGLRMIVNSLAPERILVMGELTNSWEQLGPQVMAGLTSHPLAGGLLPEIIPLPDSETARLKGAISLVLETRFSAACESLQPA